ncbi:MAG: rRNA maturation RNase YbeY [Saprospiraceae bacterium]
MASEVLDWAPDPTWIARHAPWIERTVTGAGCRLHRLEYTFCTDDELLVINREYLDHDTLTDIITFDYCEPPLVEGEIFISLDRVRDNAAELGETPARELARVVIHGVLHLCGQGDKTPAEAAEMRRREEAALTDWMKLA